MAAAGVAPLFEGMERGRVRGERDFRVTLVWLFDAVRQFGAEEARKVVELAVALKSPSVVGFGIGGDERRAGPGLFTEVFAEARAHGLHVTSHAGEPPGRRASAALWTRSKPSASATRSPWLTIPRCWNAACARQCRWRSA